jgi:hypothetical protein
LTDQIATVSEIARDRWGRPLVVPPDGGKPVAYTRCTTYIGVLEDTYNLSRWQQRMVALGLADRPDLALGVTAHRDDKDELNKLCERAIEAAKGRAAATTGTALHALTGLVDQGRPLPTIPADAAADLEAYRQKTAALETLAVEQFVVHDELQVAGTTDRVVSYRDRRYVYDIKTGSIDFAPGKFAMQLAVYARSQIYDIKTHARTDLGVSTEWGILVHLPVGEARCDLYRVDLTAGWEGVQLATAVRAWRRRKDHLSPARF